MSGFNINRTCCIASSVVHMKEECVMSLNENDEEYLNSLLDSVMDSNGEDSLYDSDWMSAELSSLEERLGEREDREKRRNSRKESKRSSRKNREQSSERAEYAEEQAKPEEHMEEMSQRAEYVQESAQENGSIDNSDMEDLLDMISQMDEEQSAVDNAVAESMEEEREESFLSDSQERAEGLADNPGDSGMAEGEKNKKGKKKKDKKKKEQKLPDEAMEEGLSEKKPGFLKRLFGKKHTDVVDSDNTIINAEEILDETGSVSEDLEDLNLDALGLEGLFDIGEVGTRSGIGDTGDNSGGMFVDDGFSMEGIDDLADIEEKDGNSKKKKKEKKKKEKKPKEKKPKDKKKKKPKKKEPDEIIHISVAALLLGMSLMAAFIAAIYFGSQAYSYQEKVDEATSCYVDKDYTNAYEILSGLDLKKRNQAFYDQVKNIMRVEQCYNEFVSLYHGEQYELSLDSLIRGIRNYDMVLDESRELGTFDQITESYGKIIDCLSSYYGISESDARMIAAITGKTEYTDMIYSKAVSVKKPEEGTK